MRNKGVETIKITEDVVDKGHDPVLLFKKQTNVSKKQKLILQVVNPNSLRKNDLQVFHGYYVEVREGEDPMRAFRKIKKQQKEDGFFDEVKAREHFQKPSFKKREKEKLRKQTIRRASRENASWHQIPKQRGHQ